jgi:hypothetical protein
MKKPTSGDKRPPPRSSRSSKRSGAGSTLGSLPSDWLVLLRLLARHRVRFLLVGAHALAVHGIPRATADLDLFVEPSLANAKKLSKAVREFGFAELADAIPDVMAKGRRMFRMGVEPLRIDVMNAIDGVTFPRAWSGALRIELEGEVLFVLGLRELRANKKKAGRLRDLADLESIDRLQR